MKTTAPTKKTASTATKKASPKESYLTKRILISAAKRGFKEASEEAMQLMGYIVIAKDGWVIKKYADGTIERLKEIEINPRDVIALD